MARKSKTPAKNGNGSDTRTEESPPITLSLERWHLAMSALAEVEMLLELLIERLPDPMSDAALDFPGRSIATRAREVCGVARWVVGDDDAGEAFADQAAIVDGSHLLPGRRDA